MQSLLDFRTHVLLVVEEAGAPLERKRLADHTRRGYASGLTVKQCAARWISRKTPSLPDAEEA